MEIFISFAAIVVSLISASVSIAAYRHVTHKVPVVQLPIHEGPSPHIVRDQASHIQAVLEIKRLLKQAKIKSAKLDKMLDSWLHHASERLAKWMEDNTYQPTPLVNHEQPLPEWVEGDTENGSFDRYDP